MIELVMRCPNPRCEHGRLVEVGVGEYISDTDMGPCPDCKGAGVVPDVVGQLQTEAARLRADRDAWAEAHQGACESHSDAISLCEEYKTALTAAHAKVKQLTEERDHWKSLVQKELPEAPGVMDTLHTGYYAGARQGDVDGFLWMMAADARIQSTYAVFYRLYPEHQRGYWNCENASAAANTLVDFVNQYSELVRSAAELTVARAELERLAARGQEAKVFVGEWSKCGNYWTCPTCGGDVDNEAPFGGNHRPGCERRAWLAEPTP